MTFELFRLRSRDERCEIGDFVLAEGLKSDRKHGRLRRKCFVGSHSGRPKYFLGLETTDISNISRVASYLLS